jgi:hypothetical protein
LAAYYRFYLLQADNHIARRREDYFANDAIAMVAAKRLIGDFPGVEIWCGPRKVVTLSREAAVLQPQPHQAARLISRNRRLLQQAASAVRRTEALRAQSATRRHSDWAPPDWRPPSAPTQDSTGSPAAASLVGLGLASCHPCASTRERRLPAYPRPHGAADENCAH